MNGMKRKEPGRYIVVSGSRGGKSQWLLNEMIKFKDVPQMIEIKFKDE